MITLAIVDDPDIVRQSIAESLEKEGSFYVIFQAPDAESFFTHLDDSTMLPDLFLIDLQLPQINDFDVLQQIKKTRKDAKVIIYSSFLNDYNIFKAYKLGASSVFSKEQGTEELVRTLIE